MRLTFTLLLGLMCSFAVQAQTLLYSENFETNTLPDSVTMVGTGTRGTSTSLFSQGLRSDSMRIAVAGDSVVMTTQAFTTTANSFVMLYFDHICKIEFFDEGYVEVSNDNGVTWVRLTGTQYQGLSQFATQGNKFTAAAYATDWAAGVYAVPSNAWWKSETFDISLLVGNAANVKVRFVLRDATPGNTMPDNYAWFIDNIRVMGAFSELNPPILTMLPPIVQDTVYSTGPYVVRAHITDQSLVDTALLVYWVNVGTPDTIGMTRLLADTFQAAIPFFGFGKNIHYYVVAIDGSAAHNTTTSTTYHFYCKFSTGGTYTVGTGTAYNANTGYPAPYGNYYWGAKHQFLILASELAALGAPGGAIGSLAFNVQAAQSIALQNFTIKMGHTTQTAMTTTYVPTLTQVYTTASYTDVLGWNTHTFQTPFVWNGVDNLVIETCFNNGAYIYNASTYYSTTPFTSVSYHYNDAAGVCAVTAASTTSPSRPNMKIEILGVTSLNLDAGVGQIVYPTGGVIANTSFAVTAKVKNFGTDTLYSATVNWKLDGVLQTPYPWTGSLLKDSLSPIITLGTISLPLGVHSIVAWTDNPNGQPDLNTGNDSSKVNFMACASLLAGTYTIGGTTPDFADFSAAMLALEQCGINGPVVFNVASGTYTEQFTIPFISGTSAINTVTFQSATGDSTAVILQYNSNISSSNFTMKLNGSTFMIFKKMTIQSLNTTNGRAVALAGGANNNLFTNCVLTGVVNTLKSTTAERAVVYSGGDVDPSNTFSNNRIVNGEHGIYLSGTAMIKENGTVITGNTFEGQTISGITMEHQASPLVKGNFINSTNLVDVYRGIYLTYSNGDIEVLGNNVVIQNATSAHGIELAECIGTPGDPGLVANNMVAINLYLTTTNTMYPAGLVAYNSSYQRFYYNSVNIYGTSTQANATFRFYNNTTNTGIDILNNNLVNHITGGTLLNFDGAALSTFSSNYNNLYATSGPVAYHTTNHADLAVWKTYSSKDLNSFVIKPYFNSNTDLHTFNGLLNGLASPQTFVNVDIDGQLRDTLNPDPGADEFNPPAIDVAVLEIIDPAGGCRMDSTEAVTVMIKNTGTSNITTGLAANFRFNNSSTFVTESISTPLNSGDTLLYTFTATVNMNVYALGTADTFNLKVWTSLTGDPVPFNDSLELDIASLYTPLSPIVHDTTILYGNQVTLPALSPDTVLWYAQDTSSVELHQGAYYTTPPLFNNTTYWVAASTGSTQSSGPYTPGLNIAPLATASASNCSTGPCSTLNDLNLGTCGTQQMWISTSTPPSLTPHVDWIDFEWTVPKTVDGMKIHHAQNTARFLTGGTMYKWDAGVWVSFHTFSNLPMQCENIVPFPLVTTTKIRITSFQMTGTGQLSNPNFREIEVFEGKALGCESERVPLTVTVGPPPPEDAGIASVVSPAGSVPSGFPQPIKVKLKNFGSDTLQQVKVFWTLNNVLQDSLMWTGSLLQDSTEILTLDTVTFAGGIYCIKSWTSLPNGIADIVPLNDTANVCFNACMSGTYTIGPSSGTYDFNTFNSALNTLIASGICGHVIFDVYPGTYTEQLTISPITGMDENNTVTFRGSTGDSTLAILQYSATGTADNWTIRLNNADYFRFEKLTIKANNVTYGRVVEMINGAMYNRFVSNKMVTAGASSSTTGVIYDYNTLNHYNTYLNNYMEGGYYTMYIYGISTSSREKGTVIQGNEIVGSYYYPMYVYYSDSVQIIGNKIHSGVSTYSYGIAVYYPNQQYRIIGNTVKIVATAGTVCYGLRDYYGNYYSYNPSPTGYGLVANNMISISGGSAGHYGLYAYNCNGTEYYYNTISTSGGSSTYYSLYQYNTTSNPLGQKFLNNIFTNTGGGYAAYYGTPASVVACDHNNYYASGTTLAYWNAAHSTLASLQAASGKDSNSVNLIPPFNAVHDLHLSNTLLSAKAIPIPAVTVDIDGDPRSLMPTIGADEIPLLGKDAGVVTIITPGTLTNESQVYPVEVTIANFGLDTIFSMDIQYTVNNGTPVVYQYSDTLLPTTTENIILAPMTSPAGNSVICAKTILVGDSNYFNDQTCKTFFGTPLYDARITRMVGLEDGCGIGLDTVSIWVKNQGVNAINSPTPSTVTVHYQIDATLPIVTENFTPVVLPNDSVLFHFATLGNFTVTTLDDTFKVATWIDLTGDNVAYNDSGSVEFISMHTPVPPVVHDTIIPYGTIVTLPAQSPDSVYWYNSATAQVEIAKGATYTTPVLYSNTTYWVQAGTSMVVDSSLYTGTQSSNYAAAQTRGYHFTAPVDMTITELMVPSTVTSGTQYIQVVKFSGYPLVYPSGSTFTTLAYISNAPFGVPQPVNIPIMAGDQIGIIGASNSTGTTMNNSYGQPQVATTINGMPVVLTRLVYQSPLVSGQAASGSIGLEVSANIARVDLKYQIGGAGCASARVPLNVTVANQQPCDVGVFQIVQPVSAVNLGTQETVKVKVRNFGSASQTNIPVSFQIDNLPPVTETITATLLFNDSLEYTFLAKANLAIVGNTYQMKAWTGITCDNTHQNDTTWKTVMNMFPAYCPSNATSTAYEDMTNVTLHTLNNTSAAVGSMYTNFTATVAPPLLSPGITYPISISTGFPPSYTYQYACWVKAYIDFNRDGTLDGVTEMVYSSATTSSNTVTGTVLIPPTAMSGNTLLRVVFVETSAATGVNPCGTYSWGETEDYMITITPQGACDAGITSIVEPGGTTLSGTSLPVKVVVMNFGSDPIAPGALSLSVVFNNGTPVIIPYTPGLASMGVDTLTLPNITANMGYNTLCVKTILACDTITFNDEKCRTVFGLLYTTIPYFDDFEGQNVWYKPDVSTNWQYGTPSASIINSAYSGSKAWATNLTGNYGDNANEYIYSPIFDFTALGATDTVTLSFYHWMDVAASDYGKVQYTFDGGANWANLGFFQDPLGTNWYNTQVGGVHYFSLTNTGWMQSSYKLTPATFNIHNEVQFRFHFYSNASGNANGWAIDNFKLGLPMMPNDVGVTAINYPMNDTAAGSVVNAKVTITNYGANVQTMFPVLLKLNGVTVATETWSGTLPSLGTTTYTFVLPFTVPTSQYQLCAETQLTGDAFPVNDGNCGNFSPLPAYHDAGIGVILAPMPDSVGHICFYHSQAQPWYKFDVVVRLRNYGQNAQTSIPLKYTFSNGGTVHTDSWTGNLATNDSVDITLNTQFLPALGAQQLCVETDLVGDPVSTNNKTCKSYTGVACIGIDDPGTGGFVLEQNIPNPSGSNTLIGYTVPQGGTVSFGLVDIVGQVLRKQTTTEMAGHHQIELDVTALAQGVYYYYIEFNGQRLTRKMVVRR